ncbi:MAG: hypothetical protein EOM30_07020 [Clostridia bacterium]|jgi:hypothetical protein|nr:hypothetical protein [Clostridia bacterium]NLS85645.1 hypothetical protein [Oscillospiraceae bacterium]
MASGASITGGAIDLSKITVAGTTNAGGIVGSAVNPIFNFTPTVAVKDSTISGATNVGGLVGNITSGGNLPIDSKYTVTGNTLTPAAGGNAGGLFGMYTAAALNNTLTISVVSPSSKLATPDTYYGGLIGQVGANTYVKIDKVSETTTSTAIPLSFGGITAYAGTGSVLDVNNITVNGVYTTSASGFGGGLVGAMTAGAVLRFCYRKN